MQIFLIFLRTILRFFRDIDGICTWIVRSVFKPKYQVTGQCLKRGICCHNIGVYLHKSILNRPILKHLVIGWYAFVYNFEVKGESPEAQVVVFRCRYLKNNRCSIYYKRPYICRQYPYPLRFFAKPSFLPGCGYSLK